jgi:hypothetical protein
MNFISRDLVRRITLIVVGVILLALPSVSYATPETYTETQVKAAYILKIRDFITWPEHKTVNQICVIGDDLIGVTLSKIQSADKRIKDVTIVRLDIGFNMNGCGILYIGPDSHESIDKLLILSKGQNILTISDFKNFVLAGGMIRFFQSDGRIRFDINEKVIKENGLDVSSRLLQIAREVFR